MRLNANPTSLLDLDALFAGLPATMSCPHAGCRCSGLSVTSMQAAIEEKIKKVKSFGSFL
ncbi:hypothetical protein FIBSPDRAFT_173463 [Athelia psychrophila]|uniref:Uncharacterized protein n=1 Tax=Athelia psychrophila TaxID=1759441 RepID=A0A166ASW6_9AGAM|nr:hypothetical protein FIBSPDRAFT_173463 [Fibularhizoctonia sp. CBS 109695]